jgi:gas vesicle protein
MSDNDSDFGSFLAGFVIGGLVGAAVALIMAPQSGAETRSQITGKGREFVDSSEQRFHEAVETADAYAQEVGERAAQFGQEVEAQARIVLDAGLQGLGMAEDSEDISAEDAGDDAAAASG